MIHLLPNADSEMSFQLEHTSYTEVVKLIRELKNDCSSGYDKFPVKFIQPVVEEIASPICYIINSSIEQAIFPES